MRRAALGFLDVGIAEDDERPYLVIVTARALIFISNVVNEIIRDFEVVNQKILVFAAGAGHLHPAVGLPLVESAQSVAVVPECTHAVLPRCLE